MYGVEDKMEVIDRGGSPRGSVYILVMLWSEVESGEKGGGSSQVWYKKENIIERSKTRREVR
jgi:hypothetical protein